MSWDEIRKAVNSDLSVPLDERMGYVCGSFPRSVPSTTISKSDLYSGELLNINGRGAITSISANGAYYDGSNYSSNMAVYIDENTDDRRIITLKGLDSGKATISLDINSAFATLNGGSVEVQNSARIINEPLYFKESLRVTVSQSYYTSASITYALF